MIDTRILNDRNVVCQGSVISKKERLSRGPDPVAVGNKRSVTGTTEQK